MTPSQEFKKKLSTVGGWKGELMQEVWDNINTDFPQLELEWKWGTACWSYKTKLILATSSFKTYVKINFFQGAQLTDPNNFFNCGLDSKQHRSRNIIETDVFPKKEFIAMLSQAIKSDNLQ